MKNYNVLFLGLLFTFSLSSMEDNSDRLKAVQERVKQEDQKLVDKPNDDPQKIEGQKELQRVDSQINVFARRRQEKVQEMKDLLKAAQENAREVQECRQKRLNDKADQNREALEGEEGYDDFDWEFFTLEELGKKK